MTVRWIEIEFPVSLKSPIKALSLTFSDSEFRDLARSIRQAYNTQPPGPCHQLTVSARVKVTVGVQTSRRMLVAMESHIDKLKRTKRSVGPQAKADRVVIPRRSRSAGTSAR